MPYELKKVSAVCVIEQDGKYLFIKRAHTGMADGFYMLPGDMWTQGNLFYMQLAAN